MDVPRSRPRAALRRAAWLGVLLLGLGGLSAYAARLEPRLPSVGRDGVWTGRVEKSPFVVHARGTGRLTPESIRWLTTESSGRVEEVSLRPGMPVAADTPVLRLENLELRLQAIQAARDVQSARVELLGHEHQTGVSSLELAAELATLRAQLDQAGRRAEVYAELAGATVSRLQGEDSQRRVAELREREALARRRLALLEQVAPRQRLELERQLLQDERAQSVRGELVERLLVRAGAEGILQDVLVEPGQWVVPGTAVAKVIVSRKLQAELRIPAERAGAIRVGQAAEVSTGSAHHGLSLLRGRVRRVAPAANEGSVDVEVALEGDLPDGLRPDQNVDGSIEVERSGVTLHLPRPLGLAVSGSSLLYRVDAATSIATRVTVTTGRLSSDRVEVLSGLAEDDEVILSDMSRHASAEAVLIE